MTPQEYEEEKKFVLSEFSDLKQKDFMKKRWYVEDLTKHFKDDTDVMTACIAFNVDVAATASKRLLDDKPFILELVDAEATYLRFASDRLKDDIEVVKNTVFNNGFGFEHASDRIKSDPNMIAYCCDPYHRALNHMHSSVKESPEKMVSLIKLMSIEPEQVIRYASEKIQALCKDNDPVKALQASILHDKLNEACKPKVEPQARKMKI
jgi:Domain of unknown function (DUF4116)